VLTVGTPATFSARCDVVGETRVQNALRTARQHDVYELNRLWLSDKLPQFTESRFIGWCLREIKKLYPKAILISYAEGPQGHVGTVYQATNWSYIGSSVPFEDISVVGGSNCRSVPEKTRGGVVFQCDSHGFFEGPLPPKSKPGSKNLPAVPSTLPCPSCGIPATKSRSRAWAFERDADGVLRPRGDKKQWVHYTIEKQRHEMELRARTAKHRYVWFADPKDKAILAKPILPYPKKVAT